MRNIKKRPLSSTNNTIKTKTKPYSQKSTQDTKKQNVPPSHIMALKQDQSQNYSRHRYRNNLQNQYNKKHLKPREQTTVYLFQ
jgi:hypothetical protein